MTAYHATRPTALPGNLEVGDQVVSGDREAMRAPGCGARAGGTA